MMASHRSKTLEVLRDLDPYHFEQFIADVWQEGQGWETTVTQESRDWGVDIIGTPPGRSNGVTIVQAKCYGEGTKVTSEEVQQYASIRQQYDEVTGVTIVTTSSFTTPAQSLSDRLDVKCIDADGLVEIVDRYDVREILDWYAAGKPEDWG